MPAKTIYSIIHDNLKKALVLSLGSTALVLVIFSYFSINAVEEHASNFIMKHTARVAEAGINAQNVGDVEKEVARFVESWKETQDLDARVDLFIDEKLVAHAGQLHPFNFLSTSVTKETYLPSGQVLTANVQISLLEIVIIRSAELLVFEFFILAVYFLLVSKMRKSITALTKPLEDRVSWLKSVASKLPESAKMPSPFAEAKVKEVEDLSSSIEILLREIANLENHLAKVNFDKGRVKMAENVAHNIKASIAVLQLKINRIASLSVQDRKDILSCIDSIRDVSINLLKAKKEDERKIVTMVSENNKVETDMYALVTRVCDLKKEQYQTMTGVDFDFSQAGKLIGQTAYVLPTEMHSVLCNLIDNAVEALPDGQGVIRLGASVLSNRLDLSISDNGKGISQEILQKLLTVGGTYGKESGSGIGLSHAKETLEQINGQIVISSTEGKGTAVTLKVPRESIAGCEFVNEILINQGSTVLLIDDDDYIHQTWKTKFKESGIANSLLHFYTPNEFNTWIDKNGQGPFGLRHYFFDYDLKNKNVNGLDLMELHGIGLESLLVSGLAGDSDIYKRARCLGAKCLSKDFLDDTPIVQVVSEGITLALKSVSEASH